MIVTVLLAVCGLVVAVKVAVVAPAATVTEAGTWARPVFELVKVTTAPPVGAGPLKVTVPVEDVPPTTEVGLRLTLLNVAVAAGFTVRVAVRLTLL